MKFGDIFAGVAGRAGKPQDDARIDIAAVRRIAKPPQAGQAPESRITATPAAPAPLARA